MARVQNTTKYLHKTFKILHLNFLKMCLYDKIERKKKNKTLPIQTTFTTLTVICKILTFCLLDSFEICVLNV
jgi:hypothetical protein